MDFVTSRKPEKKDEPQWPHERTSDVDAFVTDEATTIATVALAVELEPVHHPDSPPLGLGELFAAAADCLDS